jgi:glycosyltransferase involved in cell wall biosynthesis
LLERLSKRGHDVLVIDYDLLWRIKSNHRLFSRRQVFDGASKVTDNANVTVIRPGIVKLPFLDYASMLITYSREIEEQVQKFQPDVVIGMYLLSNYLALKTCKRHAIPLLFFVYEPYHEMIPSKLLRPIGNLLERRVFRDADKVVVINEELMEYAIRMGVRPKNACVIKSGIDHERFGSHVDGRPVRQRYGIEKHETVLFFMGWLYHFSGLKEILTELAKRKHDKLGIRLLIVGDGDAFEELQRMRTDLGLERCVTLAGKQPYEKIPEFIAAADLCLLPAYNNKIMRDIVPIKMYEYMAMGKPVIATRLPGIIKEFGSDNGVLYVERPEEALGKALEVLKAGTIESHGEKARHFVRNNDWSIVVNQFEDVLLACKKSREFVTEEKNPGDFFDLHTHHEE